MSEENELLSVEIPVFEKTAKPVRREASYPINKADKLFAAALFVLALIAVDSFGMFANHKAYGAGAAVFLIGYGVSLLGYARLSGYKAGREAMLWFVVLVMGALSYVFVYNQSLMLFHALFVRLTLLYLTAAVFGALMEGKTGNYILFDGINLLALIPAANWKAQWRAVKSSAGRIGMLPLLLKVIGGLVVALPLFSLVIRLLSEADANFGGILNRLAGRFEDRIFEWGWNLAAAFVVGAYLFALAYGAAHKRKTNQIQKEEVQRLGARLSVVPGASIYAVLAGVCLLYLLFICLQGSYYLDAVRGVLYEGFTYSEYARKGFFELSKISVLNMGILLGAELLCRKGEGKPGAERSRLLKCGDIGISVLTLFLIGPATAKMFLYIRAYGLTPLRVIPSLFMVFLAVVFVAVIVAQFRPVPVVKIAVFTFALGYAALSLGNMDGRIAQYNLTRYQAGTLSEYPGQTLEKGSLASVPAMYAAWRKSDDPVFKAMLEDSAVTILKWYAGGRRLESSCKNASFAKQKAYGQLKGMIEAWKESVTTENLYISP